MRCFSSRLRGLLVTDCPAAVSTRAVYEDALNGTSVKAAEDARWLVEFPPSPEEI